MIGMHVEATWGPSKPLEELTRLMELRCRVLSETSRDAAIATIINAANALRTQTKKTKPSAKVKARIAMRLELHPSTWKHGKKCERCIRNLAGHRIPRAKLGIRCKWLDDDPRGKKLFVYHVRPELERDEPYLCVAENESLVRKYETNRIRRRKNALGGLAKYTLGLAMARLSTYNNGEPAGKFAKKVAGKYVYAHASAANSQMDVELRDTLCYAIDALKEGQSSVDLALKRAANKTFGLLSRQMQNWSSPVDIGPCPFPEIVGKRSAT